MVDDDCENTPCQVIDTYKPYLHFEISLTSIAVLKLLPQKYMIAVKETYNMDNSSANKC